MRFVVLSGRFVPSEPLADDLRSGHLEAVEIGHFFSVVKAICLLVEIAEQVERFNADIGSADGALQETPVVLKRIGVNVAIYILHGVIHDLMSVVPFQALVGQKKVGIERRTRFHVLFN